MKIEQIYTGCLAQGAYFITDGSEAAIIDPLREIKPYLDRASREGVTIKYIFETHFHADFVSGHLDLAAATGAPIIYGPTAKTNFAAHIATDGEEFPLGKSTLKILHTPGHTLECVCILLKNEADEPMAVFTGDTLFIGDVGRPDLAQKSDLTQNDLAGMLFDSLRDKIMPLPDDVQVFPAHGAGSACGKKMSKETQSTIGLQKQLNYALRADMTRDEFIGEVTDGLTPPPAYFPENVRLNREGYEPFEKIMARGARPLSAAAFDAAANETAALVLDTRNQADFAAGHIPNSIFIGIDGGFAPWAGTLIPDLETPILLVADAGREEEIITRLARVGLDHTLGYLEGGFETWKKAGLEVETVESIPAVEFCERLSENKITVVDVRKPSEFENGHVADALNLPLDYINEHLAEFPTEQPFFIHCAGGYRSMIAASILKARGLGHRLVDVQGGWGAISRTTVPKVDGAAATA